QAFSRKSTLPSAIPPKLFGVSSKPAAKLLGAYFLLNIIAFAVLTKGDWPTIIGGQYALTNKETFVRNISQDEFYSYNAAIVRMFSSLLTAAYWGIAGRANRR